MSKKIIMFFGLLLIGTILLSNISALGITPARTTINFEPGLKKTVSITIMNSEQKDMDLRINAQGELKDSIILSETEIAMSAGEGSKKITYEIVLPDRLPPGLNKGEVVILQIPKGSSTSEASVGSALAVVTQIYVYVPYPGKYVESKLNVFGDGDEKKFVLPMINRGAEKISNVKAEIVIYDTNNNEVKRLETNSVSLEPLEKKEIVAKWKVDVNRGKYVAKAVLNYDGKEMLVETNFEVGDLLLDLQQIFVEDFKLGEIAKFNMVVENKWNELIKGAYAEMRVFNENMGEIASFKSASYDIPPGMQTTMVYYWDTKDIGEKLYNANVILYYSGKQTQQDLKLDVSQDEINVVGLGYVISSESGGEGGSLVFFLVLIIVVLIMMNLLWFLFLRKKLKKK